MELFSAGKKFGQDAASAAKDIGGSLGDLFSKGKAAETAAKPGPMRQSLDKVGAGIAKQAEKLGKSGPVQGMANAGKKAGAVGGEAFGMVRGAYRSVDMGLKNGVKAVFAAPFALSGKIATGTAQATAVTTGKGILWAAERPAVATLKVGGWSAKSLGAAFKAHPIAAWSATAVAAIAGIGIMANRQAHAGSAAYYQQKAAELQAQTYMNSVTPAEMAAMNARMGGQGSFADAAQQSQANGQGTVR